MNNSLLMCALAALVTGCSSSGGNSNQAKYDKTNTYQRLVPTLRTGGLRPKCPVAEKINNITILSKCTENTVVNGSLQGKTVIWKFDYNKPAISKTNGDIVLTSDNRSDFLQKLRIAGKVAGDPRLGMSTVVNAIRVLDAQIHNEKSPELLKDVRGAKRERIVTGYSVN